MTDLEKNEIRQIIREELAMFSAQYGTAAIPANASPVNVQFAYAGPQPYKLPAGSVGQCSCALCGNPIPTVIQK
jgi:hypothetical protein